MNILVLDPTRNCVHVKGFLLMLIQLNLGRCTSTFVFYMWTQAPGVNVWPYNTNTRPITCSTHVLADLKCIQDYSQFLWFINGNRFNLILIYLTGKYITADIFPSWQQLFQNWRINLQYNFIQKSLLIIKHNKTACKQCSCFGAFQLSFRIVYW